MSGSSGTGGGAGSSGTSGPGGGAGSSGTSGPGGGAGSSGTSGTGGGAGGGGGSSGTGGGESDGGGSGYRRGPGGLFDDLAGVAGGAFSVIAGLRQEVEAMARAQADAMVQRLDLVRREELDAALEVARRAREAAEALAARVAALEARLGAAAPERGPPAVESPGAGGADSAA